jgi:hypothetical protein
LSTLAHQEPPICKHLEPKNLQTLTRMNKAGIKDYSHMTTVN